MDLQYGRLIDRVRLEVRNLERSKLFYKAVLRELARDLSHEDENSFTADELLVTESGDTPSRVHLVLRAVDRETVERFHAVGLAAGGVDNGAPGERNHQRGHYAAYLLDPDGNSIEVACYGAPQRERREPLAERALQPPVA